MRRSLNILYWFLFLFVFSIFFGMAWYGIHIYYSPPTVSLEKNELTGAYDPIVLEFSQPIRPQSLKGKIVLDPPIAIDTSWSDLDTRLILTPRAPWPIDAPLQLSLEKGQTRYYSQTPRTSFSLSTPRPPKIISLSPPSGTRDVILDIEDPLTVIFDRPVGDFFIDFAIDSLPVIINQINEEKTTFEVLPKTPLLPGKEYTFDVSATWRNETDGVPVLLSRSQFTTLPVAPSTWNESLTLRVAEAKRFTRAQKTEGKYIDINLKSQIMSIFENGQILDAYVVSSGKRGMETPKGEFAIYNKADRPWSKKYSLYMPYWMAIVPSGLFGIHELPEWPGGYKEGANHLGTPVSHGCVRLGIGPAKRLYEWADIGTPVVVY